MESHAGWFLEHAWIIPAVMAASFVTILFFGKRFSERVTSGIGIFAVAVVWSCPSESRSSGSSAPNHPPGRGDRGRRRSNRPRRANPPLAVEAEHGRREHGAGRRAQRRSGHEAVPPVVETTTWFKWSNNNGVTLDIKVGTLVDGLTAMMLVTVSLISLLVHVYSKEYLKGDIRFTHYYAFLSMFTAAMLFYVMGATTLQMLVGWELVGVCSFVLIGHWWEEKPNSDAALKAFWTNRVGDVGLMLGVIVLFFGAGQTFNVLDINGYTLTPGANQTLLLVGALLLFGGVTSKSGQFPLHTWLPDAMAGPTPVSALIHAATMVVAGVYLIARMYSVFYEGLNIGTNHINYVALIGGITVLIGAGLAFVQQDIKKVLAYSTISQLGLHGHGPRCGRVDRGRVPSLHPCLLQGGAVPRSRIGEPRGAPHLRHAQDGRPQEVHAVHLLDVHDLHARVDGRVPARRLLVEGRDPGRRRPLAVAWW